MRGLTKSARAAILKGPAKLFKKSLRSPQPSQASLSILEGPSASTEMPGNDVSEAAEPGVPMKALSKIPLPPELILDIISDLLAESIDALSKIEHPDKARVLWWEREMIRCLAHVSFDVREATREVVSKCFLIGPNSDRWVEYGMDMIQYFWRLRLESVHAMSRSYSRPRAQVPIYQAYGLFWNVSLLREALSLQVPGLVIDTNGPMRELLIKARRLAEKVQPHRVAWRVLAELELEEEKVIVGQTITLADKKLNECLTRKHELAGLDQTENAEEVKMQLSILKNEVIEQFTILENLIPQVTQETLKASNIKKTLKEYTAAPFILEEPDVHHRAERILQEFDTILPPGMNPVTLESLIAMLGDAANAAVTAQLQQQQQQDAAHP